MHLTVGIDFDNTLISYDALIHQVAMDWCLITSDVSQNKKDVRDAIRRLPGGEIEWQKVQALVYGPRITEATPAPGAATFLRKCADNRVKVSIVSHKTEFANYDETGTNLRSVALSWLEKHIPIDYIDSALSKSDVYFESTRKEKLTRIGSLGCTHFIDDLEETFDDESFPLRVKKILYSPVPTESVERGIHLAGDWHQITTHLLRSDE